MKTVVSRIDSNRIPLLAGALAVLVLLLGCQLGPAGTGGNVVGVAGFAKGVITAKGSIFVNGVEYDTTGATVTLDSTAAGTDADLKVGMVVNVKGTVDPSTGRGSAADVEYSANLEGPVGAIDVTAGTFTVLGQTIGVDATTVFEGAAGLTGTPALAVGDRVEVSGFTNALTHVLNASRVEVKTGSAQDFDIKGTVSGLSAGTFVLTPPESTAPITVVFTGTLDPSIVNGSLVRVSFSGSTAPISTTADKIRLKHELEAGNGEHSEVSGVVSGFVAGAVNTDFKVENTAVRASNRLASGIADGVKVEVKGTVTEGILIASSLKLEREGNAELEGGAAAVSAGTGSFTLDGVAAVVSARTIFKDEDDGNGRIPVDHFSLANVAAGDHLRVSGTYDAASSSLLADKVERGKPGATAMVKGPVGAVSGSTLTVLGLGIDLSAPSFAAFLGQVTVGAKVEVKGTYAAPVFTATQASLDN